MARPTIYDRPMTAAERKARSRATLLATVTAELDQAIRIANALVQRLPEGKTAEEIGQITLHIDEALRVLEGREGNPPYAEAVTRWRPRD